MNKSLNGKICVFLISYSLFSFVVVLCDIVNQILENKTGGIHDRVKPGTRRILVRTAVLIMLRTFP